MIVKAPAKQPLKKRAAGRGDPPQGQPWGFLTPSKGSCYVEITLLCLRVEGDASRK